MTEAGWDDVLWSVDSAIRHFEAAAAMAEDGPLGAGDTTSYRNEMALMHAMQSGYTSFENALTRTLKLLDEDAPVGADWHRQLVERCSRPIQGTRPAILPREILPLARRLRSFRHWASHGYDEEFDRVEALASVAVAKRFAALIRPVFERFVAAIDP